MLNTLKALPPCALLLAFALTSGCFESKIVTTRIKDLDQNPHKRYFEIDPNLNKVRRHPRFVKFVSKLRPQWERFKNLAADD
jgi:hypothetical protein